MDFSWLLLTLLALPGQSVDTVLVCPRALQPAMQPWIDYRTGQGRRIALVDGGLSAEQIRQRIRQAAKSNQLQFIVLAGDADLPSAQDRSARLFAVPTHYEPAKVNVRWGSEKEIATDNWYADFDDDHLPDAAIGRLSANSPGQLAAIVAKILAYEGGPPKSFAGSATGDVWRRQVNLVAGLGGFGALVDTALESAAKSILAEGIPAAYATSLTQASWRSPYCPPPARFGEVVLGRLNEGCLFWVYMGHGQPRELDRVQVPGGEHAILRADDVARLQSRAGSPIALFLACYTAAYDARGDCLAEELLRVPGGPVAAIGGSRVTMPYGMSALGIELLKECFIGLRPTLGELLLHAKRNLVLGLRDDLRSKQLDSLASLLSPSGSTLADERLEHVHLFNLLGDPLLRLEHPRPIAVQTATTAAPGDRLSVTGDCEIDGAAIVELVVRRDRLTFKPSPRDDYWASSDLNEEYRRTYNAANDTRLAKTSAKVIAGKFNVSLTVPPHARGDCHVRVFVQGRGQFAAGAADIHIEDRPPADVNERPAPGVERTATRRQ
jgi:hypothetical protein